MGEQDFIRWGRISIQQTFEGTEKEFIFKGQVFVGEETFDIHEKSTVSLIENIAGIILDILTSKGFLTGEEEISHRICCEPEGRIVSGTGTTVMIGSDKAEKYSATVQSQDLTEGYLLALTSAFNKALVAGERSREKQKCKMN